MELSYDPDVNIAYLRFRKKRGKVTTIVVSDELNIDLGKDGKVYGIELLNAKEQLVGRMASKLVLTHVGSHQRAELRLTA